MSLQNEWNPQSALHKLFYIKKEKTQKTILKLILKNKWPRILGEITREISPKKHDNILQEDNTLKCFY